MAAHGWSADEDDLSAEPNDGNEQGWVSEAEANEDEPEAANLEAGSQACSWAEAIGLSDAEYASALPGFARDDGAPVATVHARSHSMAIDGPTTNGWPAAAASILQLAYASACRHALPPQLGPRIWCTSLNGFTLCSSAQPFLAGCDRG